jgi:hypothetical protein
MGSIIVLQIEHIDLEFNIKVFPFFPSSLVTLPGLGRQQAATILGAEGGGSLIIM